MALAKSLETLRDQVNAMAPGRDKSSDGGKASPQHTAANPDSDHEENAAGFVTAYDITHDPGDGVVSRKIVEAIVASRDPRFKYGIADAEIIYGPARAAANNATPWVWKAYNGTNAHRSHAHISVVADPALYNDTRPWQIAGAVAPPTVSTAQRLRMGQAIVDFEAQRDTRGRIEVYNPPANDGGGAYEVAGINVTYHPEQAARLKALIDEGHHREAEIAARDYILAYTNPVTAWHADPGVEFYLRDCCFNRGPTGAAKILQRGIGVNPDGIVGQRETLPAMARLTAAELLTALRAGREDYERKDVGFRANLWAGLTNRWNNALKAARAFSAEVITPEPPMADTNIERLLSTLVAQQGALIEQIAALARVINVVRGDPDEPPVVTKPTDPLKTDPVVITPPAVHGPLNPMNFATIMASIVGAIVAPQAGISDTVNTLSIGSLIPYIGMLLGGGSGPSLFANNTSLGRRIFGGSPT